MGRDYSTHLKLLQILHPLGKLEYLFDLGCPVNAVACIYRYVLIIPMMETSIFRNVVCFSFGTSDDEKSRKT